MIICLIFFGKVPSYTRYCVQQIREWSSLPIYFITNDIEYTKDLLFDYEITYVHTDELQSESINQLEHRKYSFPTSNGLPGREHLFYYSFLRLFLLENFMKKYNINNVFHLEVDNLIYNDPLSFETQFNTKGVSYMYENNSRASAAVFYARDADSLNHVNMTTLTYIDKGGWNSEMEFLGRYAVEHPDKVYILPHVPTEVSPNVPRIAENFDSFNKEWVFDPQSYGFWLTGMDAVVHTDGILTYKHNGFCAVNSTGFKYEWSKDEKGRRYVTVETTTNKCRIFNLHVHSKDLTPHMSRKFKIPSNKTLITDSSLIGLSVKPENVELITKHANRDEIFYNEGPMYNNHYTFNNRDPVDNYESYLSDLSKCRFCICYRPEQILESVYLGVIPIIQKSQLTETLKKHIKMVIVQDINNVNHLSIYLPSLRDNIFVEKSKSIYTLENHNQIISGETFQLIPGVKSVINQDIANFRHPLPEAITKVFVENVNYDLLHNSKIIQVYIQLLPVFIEKILPNLTHKFILIGHNCDFGIDSKFIPLLEDDRIIHMFSQNTLIKHPKLTAVPIGIANSIYRHGQKDILYRAIHTPINRERIPRIYVNVDPGTNWAHRGPVMDKMRQNPLATFVNRSSYFEYLMEMKHFKWVCSPKGNGADCHRTWEALYVGCIPIVDNIDNFHEFSKELPMILVDDWSTVTLEFLERETAKLKFNYDMLNFNYWKNKIEEKLQL